MSNWRDMHTALREYEETEVVELERLAGLAALMEEEFASGEDEEE